jgi:hypothetical protein
MQTKLASASSVAEYFHEAVRLALHNQQVQPSELTEFYLVNLLAEFARRDRDGEGEGDHPDEAFATRLLKALQSGWDERAHRLRAIGDTSLFLSGFFGDSLGRRLVDVDYYIAVGGTAYGHLSRMARDTRVTRFAPVYGELSGRFATFVDVLAEVSEMSAVQSNRDVVRLYRRWLRTGSQWVARKLCHLGVIPHRPARG